jgi:hypothetical protein
MKKIILGLIIPAFFFGKSSGQQGNVPDHAGQKPLKVFVLAGQSNMVGTRSDLNLLPSDLKKADPGRLFFDGQSWVEMAPGVTEPKGGFGPEYTFAQAMQQALGEPVGIIKHSKGGATLAEHWHPLRSRAENSLYGQLLEKVRLARAARPVVILGVLWMQGESDGVNPQRAGVYRDNLRLLIEQCRLEWDNPDLFFICGRVNSPVDRYPETPTVRNAQESLQMKGYRMIDLDDLPKVADGLHYNTAGILEMGCRFAGAMQKVMAEPGTARMTVEEYNDAARASVRDTSAGPVEGWPHGAGILVQGDWEQTSLYKGVRLFNDAAFQADEIPDWLEGRPFLRASSKGVKLRVTEPGTLTVLTPGPVHRRAAEGVYYLHDRGFSRILKPDKIRLIDHATGDELFRNPLQHDIYQKFIKAGEWLETGPWAVVTGFESAGKEILPEQSPGTDKGELLYNGIRLPEIWPPHTVDPYDLSCREAPWLKCPPAVIPIDVGRQLFIDDFLIEKTNLKRIFHQPVKYPGNPVLKPETELEFNAEGRSHNATATPKSGGIWWDPGDQLFKMWYEAGWLGTIALATSMDGLHWERPVLNKETGSNEVLSPELGLTPDSWTVVPVWNEQGQITGWTMFLQPPGYNKRGWILTSPDGIRWEKRLQTYRTSDRSTHFYNPFRKKWVFSLRSEFPMFVRGKHTINRSRHYYECDNILQARWTRMGSMEFKPDDPVSGVTLPDKVVWATTDGCDPVDPLTADPPQLYNLDAVAYESLMLGLFEIHHGPHNSICAAAGLPKITELMFAYSRDGFHWHRPDRVAHIPSSGQDAWDRGYVQSVGGIATIQGDSLRFYYSGFAGNRSKAGVSSSEGNGMYDQGATGMASLRRDGFASMSAGATAGLLTRPLCFSGRRLFVNADIPDGVLRVEVRDTEGNPITPFTLENSIPFTGNSTIKELTWKGKKDLSSLSGLPVRFYFELSNGALYSFWVSKDETGRSDGYVAAGGPGYNGPVDTVGIKAKKTKK